MTHGNNGDSVSSTVNVGIPETDTTNSNGTPRKGTETRPFNAGVQWIIATGVLSVGFGT